MKKLLLTAFAVTLTMSFATTSFANRPGGNDKGGKSEAEKKAEEARKKENNPGLSSAKESAESNALDARVNTLSDKAGIKDSAKKELVREASVAVKNKVISEAAFGEYVLLAGKGNIAAENVLGVLANATRNNHSKSDWVVSEGAETFDTAVFTQGELLSLVKNNNAKAGRLAELLNLKTQSGTKPGEAYRQALEDPTVQISWDKFKEGCKPKA